MPTAGGRGPEPTGHSSNSGPRSIASSPSGEPPHGVTRSRRSPSLAGSHWSSPARRYVWSGRPRQAPAWSSAPSAPTGRRRAHSSRGSACPSSKRSSSREACPSSSRWVACGGRRRQAPSRRWAPSAHGMPPWARQSWASPPPRTHRLPLMGDGNGSSVAGSTGPQAPARIRPGGRSTADGRPAAASRGWATPHLTRRRPAQPGSVKTSNADPSTGRAQRRRSRCIAASTRSTCRPVDPEDVWATRSPGSLKRRQVR